MLYLNCRILKDIEICQLFEEALLDTTARICCWGCKLIRHKLAVFAMVSARAKSGQHGD
jgi:hypothetical protein